MAKKKDEKDVLVVRDEKTGEISVVAGLNADGFPKRIPAKAENSQSFLQFDRHGDVLDNFFKNFFRQCKEPSRFGFYRVAADQADKLLEVIKDLLKDPDGNKELLAPHKVDTSGYEKKVQEEQSAEKQEQPEQKQDDEPKKQEELEQKNEQNQESPQQTQGNRGYRPIDESKINWQELEEKWGVKRPEYVAIVTGVYARALREKREPTAEEMAQLEAAFSRQGFTQGYFLDRKGPEMFGTRQEEQAPVELYAQARSTYESGENRKEPVHLYAMIRAGEPAQVAAEDAQGRMARVEGPVPEAAVNVPLTREKVEGQLSRTGGTPFTCEKLTVRVEEGLSLPLSALNALRRQVLDQLGQARAALPERRRGEYHPGVRYENPREAPALTVSVRSGEQVTRELLALGPARLYLPCDEGAACPDVVRRCLDAGVEPVALLPRVCWDRELPQLLRELETLKGLGVREAMAGTLDGVRRAVELGFLTRGDFGLGVYNSQTLKELKKLGLRSATASFELKLAQIRDLSKAIPLEAVVYGRLPLMLTENCIVHNHTGQHSCGGGQRLVDRKGESFPVVKAWGCRNEILNGKTLFLADKAGDYQRLGLESVRLMFTTETPEECVRVLERYQGRGRYKPGDLTRGLYYRDVE